MIVCGPGVGPGLAHSNQNVAPAASRTSSAPPMMIRRSIAKRLVDRLHHQACVRPAKAEAVVENGPHLALLGLMRDEIDVGAAVRRVVEVERRRDDLVADAEN